MRIVYASRTGNVQNLIEKLEVTDAIKIGDGVDTISEDYIIFTYTDGLVEALNESGQQYSKESLLRVIQENHAKSGKDIARLVKEDVKKFTGSAVQHDDKTLLIVKIQ